MLAPEERGCRPSVPHPIAVRQLAVRLVYIDLLLPA